MNDPYLTTLQAAAHAKVCTKTVRLWIQAKRLPSGRTHPGAQGRWRIRLSDLERLLAGEMPGLKNVVAG